MARELTPVGGTIVLMGSVFEVVAHTTDRNGNAVEVPGKCLGTTKASTRVIVTPDGTTRKEAFAAAPVIGSVQITQTLYPPKKKKVKIDDSWKHRKPKKVTIVIEPARPSTGTVMGTIAFVALLIAFLYVSAFYDNAKIRSNLQNSAEASRR